MYLAGVPVPDASVLELARLLDDDALATRLEDAWGRKVRILALDLRERDAILAALHDPPPGLEELRGVLGAERTWRAREGL